MRRFVAAPSRDLCRRRAKHLYFPFPIVAFAAAAASDARPLPQHRDGLHEGHNCSVRIIRQPLAELRGCVNSVVGLGSHSLSHSFPVPNKSYGFRGRKARRTVLTELRSCVNRVVSLGFHSLSDSSPVPNKPYGFCGRNAP